MPLSVVTTYAAIFGVVIVALSQPWWQAVIALLVTAYLTWLAFELSD